MKAENLNKPQEQQCNIHDVINLLPCPFCGSKAVIFLMKNMLNREKKQRKGIRKKINDL